MARSSYSPFIKPLGLIFKGQFLIPKLRSLSTKWKKPTGLWNLKHKFFQWNFILKMTLVTKVNQSKLIFPINTLKNCTLDNQKAWTCIKMYTLMILKNIIRICSWPLLATNIKLNRGIWINFYTILYRISDKRLNLESTITYLRGMDSNMDWCTISLFPLNSLNVYHKLLTVHLDNFSYLLSLVMTTDNLQNQCYSFHSHE